MKIVIDNETYDISDELADEIRERARAESGEFVVGESVFTLCDSGRAVLATYRDDPYHYALAERGRISRSREYLERYDARELARERLRRAYLKVVGDWRWDRVRSYHVPVLYSSGVWGAFSYGDALPIPYRFQTGDQAAQFGTDNDADLRLVMEVD